MTWFEWARRIKDDMETFLAAKCLCMYHTCLTIIH